MTVFLIALSMVAFLGFTLMWIACESIKFAEALTQHSNTFDEP